MAAKGEIVKLPTNVSERRRMVRVCRVIISPELKRIQMVLIQMEELLITIPVKHESDSCLLDSSQPRGILVYL
jgi:hypothetical protein